MHQCNTLCQLQGQPLCLLQQQVIIEKQVSFPEARRLMETTSGAVAGKSCATAVKVSTTNASVQTDLMELIGLQKYLIFRSYKHKLQKLFRNS